jgi:hypothetical protein
MYHVLLYGSECKESQNMTHLVISYHQSYAPLTKYVILEICLRLCISIHNMVRGREREREKKKPCRIYELGSEKQQNMLHSMWPLHPTVTMHGTMVHCIYLFAPPTFHRSWRKENQLDIEHVKITHTHVYNSTQQKKSGTHSGIGI